MTRSGKRAKEIEVCSRCGQPLVELLWSESDGQRIYILTCDNAGCACYRTPVKTITKEAKYGQEQEQKQGQKREEEA